MPIVDLVAPKGADAKALGAMLESERWRQAALAEIVRVLRLTRGNATRAAELLEVSPRTMRAWLQAHDDLRAALEKIREG